MPPAILLAGPARTPIGKFGGTLASMSAPDLGTTAAKAALERAGVPAGAVDETIFGHGRQAGQGPGTGRQVSVRAGVPVEVPAYTVNMACGSLLEGRDPRRRGRRGRPRGGGPGGRHGEHVEHALLPPAGALGVPARQRPGGRRDVSRRVPLPPREPADGRDGREPRPPLLDHPRRAGRLRGAKPGPLRGRPQAGPLRGREGDGLGAREGGARRVPRGRARTRRHHGREPGVAGPGLLEDRHRHGRQRVGHHGRRLGDRRAVGGRGEGARRQARRAHRRVDPGRRRPEAHGDRARARRPEAPRRRRSCASRTSTSGSSTRRSPRRSSPATATSTSPRTA